MTVLPSDRGECGVCVKLRTSALIPALQCGVSAPNKGGGKKTDVERERAGSEREKPQRVPSAFASLARCVRAVIMRLLLKLKTCRRRAHCGTHGQADARLLPTS